MVKNTQGGHHKNQARKNSFVYSNKTRLSVNSSEIYAKVVKIFGDQFDAITIDGNTVRVIIRGKFSGKFKRSNSLAVNSFVLIGSRDWSSQNIFDLLEIYSINDLSSLSLLIPSFFDASSYILSIDSTISTFIPLIDRDQNIDQNIDFDFAIL